ncbi:MAG: Ldh family oxidoreductase [Acidobacteria bacterium]|nr:Ldh family oxidoreductase [Acidobacteriota bacterium]
MPVIAAGHLQRLIEEILTAVPVPLDAAQLVARTLTATNLRGIDSHGVQLLTFYVDQLLSGDMSSTARGRIASENGGCLSYDGENGIGQVIASECTAHAVRLAQDHGLGLVTARESNHFGAAYWWARKMASQGMIGITMCNASALVPPWQGKSPRFGTNPICMAVPGDDSWLLDMATTTVAAGRIFKANINGQAELPPGWAMDAEGVPTTDTATAMRGLLMPLGGYKGYGLAMMVEILTGLLSGGAVSTELGGIRWRGKPTRVSQMYLAIDIERFMPLDRFNQRIAELSAMMKSSEPAKGQTEVLIAGEPERRIETERLRDGIPIPDGNWQTLRETGGRVGVTVTEA